MKLVTSVRSVSMLGFNERAHVRYLLCMSVFVSRRLNKVAASNVNTMYIQDAND